MTLKFSVRRVRRGAVLAFVAWGLLSVSGCDHRNDTPTPPASGGTTPSETATALPQQELAAAFDSSNTVVFTATTSDDWNQFKPQQQVELKPDANGLTVVVTGADPNLILPPFASGKTTVIQIVINSPAETVAQLFHLSQTERAYAEGRSQIVNLTPGRNVIYFRLDQPDLVDPVRLDPGAVAGEYLIESVIARAVP